MLSVHISHDPYVELSYGLLAFVMCAYSLSEVFEWNNSDTIPFHIYL